MRLELTLALVVRRERLDFLALPPRARRLFLLLLSIYATGSSSFAVLDGMGGNDRPVLAIFTAKPRRLVPPDPMDPGLQHHCCHWLLSPLVLPVRDPPLPLRACLDAAGATRCVHQPMCPPTVCSGGSSRSRVRSIREKTPLSHAGIGRHWRSTSGMRWWCRTTSTPSSGCSGTGTCWTTTRSARPWCGGVQSSEWTNRGCESQRRRGGGGGVCERMASGRTAVTACWRRCSMSLWGSTG